MKKSYLASLFLVVFCSSTPLARADVESTITKARAYLGSEEVLSGLRSVRYTGTLETVEVTAEGSKPVKVNIEILFEKPYRQRIVATADQTTETTGLDDYEAWQRLEDRNEASRWRMTLLSKDQIKRLRANVWENFAFFRGIEKRGGRVDDLGVAIVGGKQAHKLAFVHEQDIVFYRSFDEATGRLLLTETEQGGTIQEEGEMIVSGIRFPRRLIQINKAPDGMERRVEITFEKITVNESFPDTYFAVPAVNPS